MSSNRWEIWLSAETLLSALPVQRHGRRSRIGQRKKDVNVDEDEEKSKQKKKMTVPGSDQCDFRPI